MSKTSSNAGRTAALVISVGISVGIVVYLFAKLDWAEVWTQVRRANPWMMAGLTLSFLVMIWMRAMRWRLLLPGREKLSIPRLMDATIVGFFASFVLPLRAGEIIRPWVASRWQPVTFSAALASIMIERLADSVILLTLLAVCLTQISEIPVVILAGAKALGLLCGVLILLVIASYALPGRMEKFFHFFSDRLVGRFAPHAAEKVNRMVNEYFAGLRVIGSAWQLLAVLGWSLGMWLVMAAWYHGLLWAFGESPTFWVAMVLNVTIAMAVAAPSAPGFVGTFQVGCILALSTVYGYSKEFAMAYSVVGHVLQMIFNVAAGLIVLHLRGLKFRQLRQLDS
ncbi:MAG TPA: lysylphosphatidylglycerol synthase transmembrane domain-containing protein [Kiritimatiellia bacterium]|nr:lysylphosphatidylglycerol synthase transmembrane domain-containing protein [Kiritimatiellia bacterium]HMO98748.1 lysylphosphatidylglycerol synthase transmembrane domain-containing protein [Kiritimatiellia bacterium]HMP95924.1 lysylphosphatidylglycerol synthase transmembrane domain-containing protein [Kiritimatiellia bacterium]